MSNSETLASIARAIANPIRIRILETLTQGPMLVQDLRTSLQIETTVLSKHLSVLRDAELVECQAEWRCRRYRLLAPSKTVALLEALDGMSTVEPSEPQDMGD